MGIKYFFSWFRKFFSKHLQYFKKANPPDVVIDVLLVDLNGIFHTCAQKIYKYGNYAPPKTFVHKQQPAKPTLKMQEECYKEVCRQIDELVKISKPRKEVILCIDGVAPLGKQNQQRQRRFRGAIEDPEMFFGEGFDPNCISPGTKFMHYLSKYIDWYIRKKITEDKIWRNLKVVFSNEKVPGEGEHKLMNYLRKFKNKEWSYCINGLDADLFMLSLGTGLDKIYLLREETFVSTADYMYISMGNIREELILLMTDDILNKDKINLINDFILICFMCGNDFLPNIQCVSICENSIEILLGIYKSLNLYLTLNNKIIKENLNAFLTLLEAEEENMMLKKVENSQEYFPDPIIQSMKIFKMKDYRDRFYKSKKLTDIEDLSSSYMRGCQWILTYYLEGVQDWKWCYKYHYAPFLSDLRRYTDSASFSFTEETSPALPFQQLLCVLPPKSSNLLPFPLSSLFIEDSMKRYCPESFNINYDGKRKKYEGIVELPFVDFEDIIKLYYKYIKNVDKSETMRNIKGKNFLYYFGDFTMLFKSHYGDIHSKAEVEEIEF